MAGKQARRPVLHATEAKYAHARVLSGKLKYSD